MAQFSRIDVYLKFRETGIVPVFYHKNISVAKNTLKACYAGGARVFEFTNRGDFAHEIFAELMKYSIEKLPGMVLGIGSVEDAATAALFMQLGANFVVSPILDSETAKICNRRKVAWIPGCGSLTEIAYAEELGAEIVKIFPAMQVGGPEFIKNIKGPRSHTNIMPTGGVKPTEENLKQWFDAGAYCVGMGSQLMVKNPDGTFNYDKIEENYRKAVAFMNKYR